MNKINTEQLLSGFIKYLAAEIIPCVEDTFTKLALKTFAITTEKNAPAYTKALDSMIEKPFIADLLKVEDIALFQSHSMELTNLISKAKALGDFSIRYDSFSAGTDLEEATDDVRRLTAAAGGNVVIMSLAKTYTYTEKVFVANGFIYKVAPQEIKKLQAPQK